ncbi:MAG: prepilin-type N-terminal cleavage/methylation domain-containing protein [Candidatus Omnitrophota bacterium]|nr:prepilin-type N-terminal cleavage/methylation domain-containing protein [Candidatus Omnitrophota bacterium]
MKNEKAFTLIELLISIAIFAVIMVSLYSAFSTGVLGLGKIEESATASQTGYTILSRIGKDLRNSFAYSADEVKFTGKNDALTFLSLTPEFSWVSYSLSGDKLLRLVRINKDALKTDSETKPKVIAQNIKQIEFTYLYTDPDTKELKENDNWTDNTTLPTAVRVRLILEKKADVPFIRTIYLISETVK